MDRKEVKTKLPKTIIIFSIKPILPFVKKTSVSRELKLLIDRDTTKMFIQSIDSLEGVTSFE